MHEISLGYSIKDYLSGNEIPATTYEDIRQEVARVLVEDKGVPRANVQAKVEVRVDINERPYIQQVDLVVVDPDQGPVMALKFCAGEVETYVRQVLAAARLLPHGPAKVAAVTDTRKALLVQVADGSLIRECAFADFPDWPALRELAGSLPAYTVTPDRKMREERLLYAFSELSCSCSQEDSCSMARPEGEY